MTKKFNFNDNKWKYKFTGFLIEWKVLDCFTHLDTEGS